MTVIEISVLETIDFTVMCSSFCRSFKVLTLIKKFVVDRSLSYILIRSPLNFSEAVLS